jgi:molybdopterin-guanine dinucleotide biosynthesis protein A
MTAVIMAGGKSTRMGRDKLSLAFMGQSLLEGAVSRYKRCFDRVIVSVSDLSKYPELEVEKVADIYKETGPIGGLHAVLKYVQEPVFLTAADMPFSSPEAALKIIELCGDNDVCALADGEGRFEPLFAYYKYSVLEQAEQALKEGKYSLYTLYNSLRVNKLSFADLGSSGRTGCCLI